MLNETVNHYSTESDTSPSANEMKQRLELGALVAYIDMRYLMNYDDGFIQFYEDMLYTHLDVTDEIISRDPSDNFVGYNY